MADSSLTLASNRRFARRSPLTSVTNFVLKEGYKNPQVAGSSTTPRCLRQRPKTLTIDAQLIVTYGPSTSARGLALTIASLRPRQLHCEIYRNPVVARLESIFDMQITDLVFTQDNVNRDTLKSALRLVNVPRTKTRRNSWRRLGRRRRCRFGII